MSYSMTESEFRDLMRVTASDGCERRQVRSGSTSLLEKQPMSYKERRARWKSEGKCVSCGKSPAIPARKYCTPCLEKHWLRTNF